VSESTTPITSGTAVTLGSGAMFDGIARRYDLLNRIISLGVDQRWRARTVASLGLGSRARVLDLATGTADLALRIARTHSDSTVVGLDPSVGMLEVGRTKVSAAALDARVELVVGDAQALPFESDSFDGCTMAFGIRNVPDRLAALREMARVVKPGAKIALLELAEPRSGILGPLARFHIHRVVPFVGGLVSGSKEYAYLQESIAKFPPPDVFAATMREAGLDIVEVSPLTFGVVCLYVATPRARGSDA